MSKDKTLSDLQMQIMRIIWSSGEATASQVHQKLSSSRPLASTTVATLLSRLEKRGLLKHRTQSRQYYYSACAVSPKCVSQWSAIYSNASFAVMPKQWLTTWLAKLNLTMKTWMIYAK